MKAQAQSQMDGNRTAKQKVENLVRGDKLIREDKENLKVEKQKGTAVVFQEGTWMAKPTVVKGIEDGEITIQDAPKLGMVEVRDKHDRQEIINLLETEGFAWLGTAETEEEFDEALEVARGER